MSQRNPCRLIPDAGKDPVKFANPRRMHIVYLATLSYIWMLKSAAAIEKRTA